MAQYNPERRAWRGRSYKRGGAGVRELRDRSARKADSLRARQGAVS